MRYSYEFKRECVELYRKGCWPDTPKGIKERNFRIKVRQWVLIEEACGLEALRHKNQNKNWTAEERYALVAQVIAGKSCKSVAFSAGISDGLLYQWVRKYKELGYNGLVNLKKGRPSKESQMKKETRPTSLSESEREELIRLRAETEYLRTELAVRKKLEALRQEKEAARLKAKRQQLSKNSETEDFN